MKKLKILAAGDIHGDSGLAKSLAEKAERENVDLVILSGDLTFSDRTPKGILAPFVRKNKKVLLIPGNHDSLATVDFLAEFYASRASRRGEQTSFSTPQNLKSCEMWSNHIIRTNLFPAEF